MSKSFILCLLLGSMMQIAAKVDFAKDVQQDVGQLKIDFTKDVTHVVKQFETLSSSRDQQNEEFWKNHQENNTLIAIATAAALFYIKVFSCPASKDASGVVPENYFQHEATKAIAWGVFTKVVGEIDRSWLIPVMCIGLSAS